MKATFMSQAARVVIPAGLFLAPMLLPAIVESHCDTMAGPVVAEAREALDSGDIAPILKWVKKDDEAEIVAAFKMTRSVRSLGPEAKELADRYFFETLVRIHRAGEGAPYTGLKPAEAVEPIIVVSDEALRSGDPEDLIQRMTDKVAAGIREHFERAYEAQNHASENIEAGREFVEAYVLFTHYVERINQDAMGGSGEQGEAERGH